MPRTNLLRPLTLALACVIGGRSLGAQATSADVPAPVVSDSSVRVRSLPAMRVTAAKEKASRDGVLALMEENRRLAAELRRHDEKVELLARRLAYLRGPVTDSVTRDITRIDAQTAEARARRQALEARLQSIEGSQSANLAP
jgi:predicted RNase H-like nuclease (RuvC/YqgF family)